MPEGADFYPAGDRIKISDTPADIAEGRKAGLWTIASVDTGNEAVDASRLGDAHFLAPSVADCPPIVEEILHEFRLRRLDSDAWKK